VGNRLSGVALMECHGVRPAGSDPQSGRGGVVALSRRGMRILQVGIRAFRFTMYSD
jgi:hypothetical protein